MTNCILNAKKFSNSTEILQNKIGLGLEFVLETETEDLKSLLFWRLTEKSGPKNKQETQKDEVRQGALRSKRYIL